MAQIVISTDDLRVVILSILSENNIDKVTSKPQLTFTEACSLYGDNRIRKFIKSGLLKPASQNGKRSAKYYSHLKITELINKSFHHLNSIEL